MVADVIAAVASHRPGDGWGGPVSFDDDTLARLEVDAKEIIAPLPAGPLGAAAAAAPRAVRGGLRQPATASSSAPTQLDLTTAEVAAVATFYTMYKRRPIGEYTRRRLHQHAVRGHGRRPDLRHAQGAPRRRPRRDHRGRQGHPRAPRVQRRLRLRAGDDGQLGVLRQPDPGVGHRARRRAAGRRPADPDPGRRRCARSSRSRGCSPASPTAGRTRVRRPGRRRWPACEIYREQQNAGRRRKAAADAEASRRRPSRPPTLQDGGTRMITLTPVLSRTWDQDEVVDPRRLRAARRATPALRGRAGDDARTR